MPMLPNPRDESLAQCVAAGMDPHQAAAVAGIHGYGEEAAVELSAVIAERARVLRRRLARAGLPPLAPPPDDWPASALAARSADVAQRLTAAALILFEAAMPSLWRDGDGGPPALLAVTSWRLH